MNGPFCAAMERRPRRRHPWLFLGAALLVLDPRGSPLALEAGQPLETGPPRFDFARQLSQATLEPETRFLDLGTREARPYLLSGWSIDELWQGKTSFVWAMGQAAAVRFFRSSPGPFTLYFRCRPFAAAGAAPQAIATVVNGTAVGLTRPGPDFQTYRLTIPGTALRAGENRLELRFAVSEAPPAGPGGAIERRRLAVAWDWIGFGTPVAPPPRADTPATAAAGALSLPCGNLLDFYLVVQPGSLLRWQSIRPWGPAAAVPGSRLEIQVEWDGGGGKTLRVSPAGFSSPQSLALDNREPALARIGFLAVPGREPDGGAPAGLTLESPELLGTAPEPQRVGAGVVLREAAGLPLGAAALTPQDAAPAPTPAAAPRPNVVLYLVDTLRADHLGVYGYPRPISPEIDAFAARAAVFTRAYAQSGWTKSSVASMLTGLHLPSHGVAEPADALPASLPTLPRMLQGLGYDTLAVTTNPAVSAESGFARGFDSYVALYDRHPGEFLAQGSEKVNAELFRWLGSRSGAGRGKPFFAFLHAMDPHAPYAPPAAYRQRFAAAADAALCRPGPREIAAAVAAHPGLSRDAIRANFEALYDAQVAHNDHDFGLLLRGLRERGLYGNTLVILVADHGEEFLDHGLFAHGHSLYQEILRVPLIVRWPDGAAAGSRVASAAQQIDLLPTILAAAGARAPAALPGMDLRQLALAPAPAAREVTSDLSMAGTRISSLVARGMHLLVRERPNPDVELYDLAADPRELHDLAGSPGVRLGYLASRLRMLESLEPGPAGASQAPIGDEQAARLRALGYLR